MTEKDIRQKSLETAVCHLYGNGIPTDSFYNEDIGKYIIGETDLNTIFTLYCMDIKHYRRFLSEIICGEEVFEGLPEDGNKFISELLPSRPTITYLDLCILYQRSSELPTNYIEYLNIILNKLDYPFLIKSGKECTQGIFKHTKTSTICRLNPIIGKDIGIMNMNYDILKNTIREINKELYRDGDHYKVSLFRKITHEVDRKYYNTYICIYEVKDTRKIYKQFLNISKYPISYHLTEDFYEQYIRAYITHAIMNFTDIPVTNDFIRDEMINVCYKISPTPILDKVHCNLIYRNTEDSESAVFSPYNCNMNNLVFIDNSDFNSLMFNSLSYDNINLYQMVYGYYKMVENRKIVGWVD